MNKRLENLTDEEFFSITKFHTEVVTEYLENMLYL